MLLRFGDRKSDGIGLRMAYGWQDRRPLMLIYGAPKSRSQEVRLPTRHEQAFLGLLWREAPAREQSGYVPDIPRENHPLSIVMETQGIAGS